MALSSKRGPKGANLAVFCIPNSYTDLDLHVSAAVRRSPTTSLAAAPPAAKQQQQPCRAPPPLSPASAPRRARPPRPQEIARPYGNVVYAQVSRHRDTGLSRGYGFVSYESVPEAESAVEGIHGLVVQGRSLRVEKVKADEEPPRAR